MCKNKLFIIALVPLLMALPALCFAQERIDIEEEKSFYFMLYGVFSLVQEMGSVGEYVPGVNDFPVTPAHSEYGGGLGFFIDISDNVALNISGEYLLGTEVTKTDPSDGETYTYKTYDNINALASLVVKFGEDIKFFASAGGGANILMPYADKEETGSLGSIIVITPPDKTMNIMAAFGAGAIFDLGATFLKIEAQYSMIFDYEKDSILLRLGFGF